jgi:hypothetical protein
VTALESARRLELAAAALRRATMAARQAAEQVGLELPADVAGSDGAALVDWLVARAADFVVETSVTGVNPNDPCYLRPWGRDTDAIRADLAAIGIVPCAFWDCVEAATHDVPWHRSWPGGSYEGVASYCARHAAELRSGARWAMGDSRVLYPAAPRRRPLMPRLSSHALSIGSWAIR